MVLMRSSLNHHSVCKRILEELLKFTPYLFQLEGTCEMLDARDLLALAVTGAGKTGLIFMPILVIR